MFYEINISLILSVSIPSFISKAGHKNIRNCWLNFADRYVISKAQEIRESQTIQ